MVIAAARPGFRHNATATVAFTPTSLAGCEFWFDAGQITGAVDNTAIATWQDKSGNGRHVTQVTGANQPIFHSTGALITPNSKPVVTFDAANDSMSVAAPSMSPLTVFTCHLMSSLTGGNAWGFSSSVTGYVGNTGREDTYAGLDVLPAAGALNLHNVRSHVFNGASSQFYRDGTLLASGDAGSNTTAGTTLYFGARDAGNGFTPISLAEFVVYSRVVSTVERQQVESYLKIKHGTP